MRCFDVFGHVVDKGEFQGCLAPMQTGEKVAFFAVSSCGLTIASICHLT
jgi:hypothetical protein